MFIPIFCYDNVPMSVKPHSFLTTIFLTLSILVFPAIDLNTFISVVIIYLVLVISTSVSASYVNIGRFVPCGFTFFVYTYTCLTMQLLEDYLLSLLPLVFVLSLR